MARDLPRPHRGRSGSYGESGPRGRVCGRLSSSRAAAIRARCHCTEAGRRHGVGQLRFVTAFADQRAESVGESRSRLIIHQVGLPPPKPQYEIVDQATGVDPGPLRLRLEEHRTVGEYDGKIKYGRLLKPAQDPGDVVYDEKLREDMLRDLGHEVARWTSPISVTRRRSVTGSTRLRTRRPPLNPRRPGVPPFPRANPVSAREVRARTQVSRAGSLEGVSCGPRSGSSPRRGWRDRGVGRGRRWSRSSSRVCVPRAWSCRGARTR